MPSHKYQNKFHLPPQGCWKKITSLMTVHMSLIPVLPNYFKPSAVNCDNVQHWK